MMIKKKLKLIQKIWIFCEDLIKIQSYEPKDTTLNKISKNFIIKNGQNLILWVPLKVHYT